MEVNAGICVEPGLDMGLYLQAGVGHRGKELRGRSCLLHCLRYAEAWAEAGAERTVGPKAIGRYGRTKAR